MVELPAIATAASPPAAPATCLKSGELAGDCLTALAEGLRRAFPHDGGPGSLVPVARSEDEGDAKLAAPMQQLVGAWTAGPRISGEGGGAARARSH